MTFLEVKEEEYSRSAQGSAERLTRGKEFIRALNVAIGEIEEYLRFPGAVILDAEHLSTQGEVQTALRKYLEELRRRKLEVRRDVGPQLIDSWLADESGYDEAAWPAVRQALDGNHTPQKGHS